MTARTAHAAVKAALVAAGVLVVDERARVSDATLTAPFVVVDPPEVIRGTDRLQRHAVASTGTVQTVAMGISSEQAGWLQEKVEAALLDVILTINGAVSDPLTMDSSVRWLEPFTALPDRVLYQCATRWRVRMQQTS